VMLPPSVVQAAVTQEVSANESAAAG
jgi:hypothetical protein